MSDLAFRPAGRTDLPSVLRLLAFLDGSDGQPSMDLSAAEAVFARIMTYPDYRIWLVEDHGMVAGTYSLLIMDNLGHGGAPEGIVENVAIEPSRRRHGIGRAMMRHAMDRCADRSCYKMALSSSLKRVDAHRFYDALGFERHGISFAVAPAGGSVAAGGR